MEDKIVLTQVLGGLNYSAARQVELTKSQLEQQLKPYGLTVTESFRVLKPQEQPCMCGEPDDTNAVHRKDKPCYMKEQPQPKEPPECSCKGFMYDDPTCKAHSPQPEQDNEWMNASLGSPKPEPCPKHCPTEQSRTNCECTCHVFYNPFKRTLLDKQCPIHGSPKDKSEPQTMSEEEIEKIVRSCPSIHLLIGYFKGDESIKMNGVIEDIVSSLSGKLPTKPDHDKKVVKPLGTYANENDIFEKINELVRNINRLSEQAKTTQVNKE